VQGVRGIELQATAATRDPHDQDEHKARTPEKPWIACNSGLSRR
jgi:hypothetical protein